MGQEAGKVQLEAVSGAVFKDMVFVLKQGAHFRAISDMEFGPVIAVYHFHGGGRQQKKTQAMSALRV